MPKSWTTVWKHQDSENNVKSLEQTARNCYHEGEKTKYDFRVQRANLHKKKIVATDSQNWCKLVLFDNTSQINEWKEKKKVIFVGNLRRIERV